MPVVMFVIAGEEYAFPMKTYAAAKSSATFGASTALFGLSTQAYPARQIQFALKMFF